MKKRKLRIKEILEASPEQIIKGAPEMLFIMALCVLLAAVSAVNELTIDRKVEKE